jgi:hypothetical protein
MNDDTTDTTSAPSPAGPPGLDSATWEALATEITAPRDRPTLAGRVTLESGILTVTTSHKPARPYYAPLLDEISTTHTITATGVEVPTGPGDVCRHVAWLLGCPGDTLHTDLPGEAAGYVSGGTNDGDYTEWLSPGWSGVYGDLAPVSRSLALTEVRAMTRAMNACDVGAWTAVLAARRASYWQDMWRQIDIPAADRQSYLWWLTHKARKEGTPLCAGLPMKALLAACLAATRQGSREWSRVSSGREGPGSHNGEGTTIPWSAGERVWCVAAILRSVPIVPAPDPADLMIRPSDHIDIDAPWLHGPPGDSDGSDDSDDSDDDDSDDDSDDSADTGPIFDPAADRE